MPNPMNDPDFYSALAALSVSERLALLKIASDGDGTNVVSITKGAVDDFAAAPEYTELKTKFGESFMAMMLTAGKYAVGTFSRAIKSLLHFPVTVGTLDAVIVEQIASLDIGGRFDLARIAVDGRPASGQTTSSPAFVAVAPLGSMLLAAYPNEVNLPDAWSTVKWAAWTISYEPTPGNVGGLIPYNMAVMSLQAEIVTENNVAVAKIKPWEGPGGY